MRTLHSPIASGATLLPPAAASTQGARRATEVDAAAGDLYPLITPPPDPEVPEAKPRRRFTAAYKMRLLDQADRCAEPGQIGALLRSEGLYSSHLTNWRKQREQGILNGLTPAKRGRKAKSRNSLAKRLAELERENLYLQNKLKQARIIIEAQKKISEIPGIEQSLEQNAEIK